MSYDSLKVEDLVRHKNITGPLDIIFGILSWLERGTHNAMVDGSSPSGSTIYQQPAT